MVYAAPGIVVTVLGLLSIIGRRTMNEFQMAVTIILYQLHPTIMIEAIESLRCVAVPGTGTPFLVVDMTVDCSSADYRAIRIVSFINLFVYV
jgi:hypothetical protein